MRISDWSSDVCSSDLRPLVELAPAAITDLDRTIARYAEAFIPERATLQVGIGAVPEAVMANLRSHRDLSIHSGMLGDSAAELVECGAVTNVYKEVDPGVMVTGALIGKIGRASCRERVCEYV